MNTIVIICFFFSGIAGLIYEICWIRKASLIFGSTTFALSTILAVFFAGLAIGSYLFGRLSKKQHNPLRWYALLELMLAIIALASLYLFDTVSYLYSIWFYDPDAGNLVSIVARIMLVSLVLLPPTILMGGTLPLLCRYLIVDEKNIAGRIGLLYGINTLGAVIGCAVTGFWLLPEIGVKKSVLLAVALNFFIAIIAGYLSLQKTSALGTDPLPANKPRSVDKNPSKRIYSISILGLMFFMTGFVAIGSEVLWSRFLTLLMRNTIHTYTITLSVVLTGIVIGSFIASRLFDRRLPLMDIFAILQAITAMLSLTLMLLPAHYWRELGQGILPVLLLMLIPAIISGICFPLINRLAINDFTQSSSLIGRMSAINITGGVLGSLSIGFILLPHFGLQISLQFITGVALVTGIIAVLTKNHQQKPSSKHIQKLAWMTIPIVAWMTIPLVMNTRLPDDYLGEKKLLVDVEEGYGSTLSVNRNGSTLQLKIDRLWQGTDVKNHQSMVAHIPMLLHTTPKDILVIGVGVGQTASRFLYYDVNSLDVVDIEPAIFPFIRRNFESQWMDNPLVSLLPEDGHTYVEHGRKKYDIISIEVGQVFRPGIESFYTVEFYQKAKKRLQADGLIAQFISLAFFRPEQFKSILSTFQSVFPNCILWYNTQEMLLIGKNNGELFIDPSRIELLTYSNSVSQDMAFSYWGDTSHYLNNPDVFLAGFVSGSEQIASLSSTAPLYIDDVPSLAYAVSDSHTTDHNEIELIHLINGNLSDIKQIYRGNLSAGQQKNIAKFRSENLNNIIANAHLAEVLSIEHSAQPKDLVRLTRKALQLNPGNAMANRMAGNAYLRVAQPRQAAHFYQKAISIKAGDAIAHRGLALANGQLGLLDQSIEQAKIALSIVPNDPETLSILGLGFIGRGQVEDAIIYLEKSLKLDPENIRTKENLALARKRAVL